MEVKWIITYHESSHCFTTAEDAFRFFLTFHNKRDAKTANIQHVNDSGELETIKI